MKFLFLFEHMCELETLTRAGVRRRCSEDDYRRREDPRQAGDCRPPEGMPPLMRLCRPGPYLDLKFYPLEVGKYVFP